MVEQERASGDTPAKPTRRRASRAAGPAAAPEGESAAKVVTSAPVTRTTPATPTALPPRQPHRALVALVSGVAALVAAVALVVVVAVLMVQHRHAEDVQARDQR